MKIDWTEPEISDLEWLIMAAAHAKRLPVDGDWKFTRVHNSVVFVLYSHIPLIGDNKSDELRPYQFWPGSYQNPIVATPEEPPDA